MAYPGDYHEDGFNWKTRSIPQRHARRSSIEPKRAPVNTSVAITGMGLVFASLLAGGLLTVMLFGPKENHSATTLPADVIAGVRH